MGTTDSFQPLEVVCLPALLMSPPYLGLPDRAAVVSANKVIGFGKTGTQEEVNVGESPEACPAVLITPTLADREVLVMRGAEAMISISGYGRDICLEEVLEWSPGQRLQASTWMNRTMLFTDALELDLCEVDNEGDLVEFIPANIERELIKAQMAFSSGAYSHVASGFWGCRAFGGNPDVKSVMQWCAASMARTRLNFVCSGPEQCTLGIRFEEFARNVQEQDISVSQVMDCLLNMEQVLCHGRESQFWPF